jgi:sugar fermentation stimulation protein A
MQMQFPSPLIRGTLLRRYKRFLAEVQLDEGGQITAAVPNTGSMLGLCEPGSVVWLSRSARVTRKYPHTWELIETDLGQGPTLVGINTSLPNKLVEEAIDAGTLTELTGYPSLRREVKYGLNSRIDLLLAGANGEQCYVEVKNVHMSREPGLAEFPDCVSERAAKHLVELSQMVCEGHRAVMVYLVQRGDAETFQLAADFDPKYALAFERARVAGVEALAYACDVTVSAVTLTRSLPFAT